VVVVRVALWFGIWVVMVGALVSLVVVVTGCVWG
jgi:hypothetical protein